MSPLPQIKIIPRSLKLSETDQHYVNKLMKTMALFAVFVAFGVSRSLQGPTLLELQKQVGVSIETFQIVFLIGAITFPLGNLLAGFIMERINTSLFLSLSTVVLSLSFVGIPFAPNIGLLSATSAVAELALGMIDTGANVYCLDLWDTKSGPYFNALHLSQSLGFMIAPILAETVLAPESDIVDLAHLNETTKLYLLEKLKNLTHMENLTEVMPAAPHANLVDPSEILALPLMSATNLTRMMPPFLTITRLGDDFHTLDFDAFNPVQSLYLTIGFCIFLVALCFVAGIPGDRKDRNGSYSFDQKEMEAEQSSEKEKSSSLNPMDAFSSSFLYYTIVILMTLYCVCANGLSFAYGHFLTAYAVKSSYALTALEGARLTSVYYAAQVIVRGINIPLILKVSRLSLVALYLGLVALGALTLLLPFGGLWALRIGSVMVGLGAGSLFPVGLLWMQDEMGVNSRLASLFCLGTSLGAQLFRLPEAAFLDSVPEVHIYLLITASAASIACFVGSLVLLKWSRAKKETNSQEVEN